LLAEASERFAALQNSQGRTNPAAALTRGTVQSRDQAHLRTSQVLGKIDEGD